MKKYWKKQAKKDISIRQSTVSDWTGISRTKETGNCTSDRTEITLIPTTTMKYGVISNTWDLQNATATTGKKRRKNLFSSG